MSKTDLDKYYEEVCAQYHDFVTELKEFEELCSQQLISPQVVTSAKQAFEPVKRNWQMLNYVMYLVNKPVRKKKHGWYNKQTQTQVKNSLTKDDIITENKESHKKFREIISN